MQPGMGRIVVLDDDEVIVELLRTLLVDAGHVPVAARGLAGLPADPGADLVLTDLIPVQGYRREVAKDWIVGLRRRFGGVPIVILTAHRAALAEPDALGADGIVVKPFDVEALLAEIEKRLSAAGHRQPPVTS